MHSDGLTVDDMQQLSVRRRNRLLGDVRTAATRKVTDHRKDVQTHGCRRCLDVEQHTLSPRRRPRSRQSHWKMPKHGAAAAAAVRCCCCCCCGAAAHRGRSTGANVVVITVASMEQQGHSGALDYGRSEGAGGRGNYRSCQRRWAISCKMPYVGCLF